METNTIITGIIAFGLLIGGVGYAISQFFKGRNDNRKDAVEGELSTLTLLSKKVDALEKLSNDQDREIAGLRKEVGELKTAIQERDKKIDEYILILQNRNPQFDNFVTYITRVATESEAYMKETSHSINHIKTTTDKLFGATQAK